MSQQPPIIVVQPVVYKVEIIPPSLPQTQVSTPSYTKDKKELSLIMCCLCVYCGECIATSYQNCDCNLISNCLQIFVDLGYCCFKFINSCK